MQHVDEGTLHAFLDGALYEEEQRRVARHIDECPACRTLLETEQQIRERAQELLADDAGREVPIPPFETVLRRHKELTGSEKPAKPGGHRAVRRLSWAASIVLAAGLGWVARGSLLDTGNPPVEQVKAAPESTAPEKKSAVPDSAAPAIASDKNEIAAARERKQARRAEEQPKAPVRGTLNELDQVAKQPQPQRQLAEARDRLEAELQAPALAGRRDQPAVEGGFNAAGFADEAWHVVTPAEARAMLGREPVTIPGFPVTSLASGNLDGLATVRVNQLIQGDTVTLFQSPVAVFGKAARLPVAAAQAARDKRAVLPEFVIKRAGLTIEIRGPVSRDSLARLARLIPRR